MFSTQPWQEFEAPECLLNSLGLGGSESENIVSLFSIVFWLSYNFNNILKTKYMFSSNKFYVCVENTKLSMGVFHYLFLTWIFPMGGAYAVNKGMHIPSA